MTYYVITNGSQFDIVKVLPADDANFQQDYGNLVQASGPDFHELLHRYAAYLADQLKVAPGLRPKLTRVKACYPNHEVLRIKSYYKLNLGWVACSRIDPVDNRLLTWLEQLAIAMTAGAARVQLVLTRKKTGHIIYSDFSINEILH